MSDKNNKRYNNYHKHTHYSNIMTLDCVSKPIDYIKRAKELGHTTYFTTEHGYQGNIYEAYSLCKENGLKCVYGVEAYYVDNRFDKTNRNNYHLCIIAMTEQGRKQINKIISQANIDGFYYKPRIDLELLLTLNPLDVVITTACIASRMFKEDWYDKFFIPVYKHFGDSLFLEVQSHNSEKQIEYNKQILEIANKHNIKIIHANDSHYILPSDKKYRDMFLKAKDFKYDDEEDFELDYPSYDEIVERYKKQNVLSDDEIEQALNNTLVFDKSEGITIDTEFKIPKITKGDSNLYLKNLLNLAWHNEKKNIPIEKHPEYKQAIKYEYNIVKKCGMADYFILDHLIVNKAVNEYDAVITHTGRGSAVSFYINKLLGLTEIDRIKAPIKLYPTRFMSAERILSTRSLPDIDLNFANVEPVIKASKDYLGEDGIRQMVAFKPMQNSSAFRLWCKALDMNIKEYDEVAKDLTKYKKQYDGIYKDDEKWGKIIQDSMVFKGVIESISTSPCSYLLYDKSIMEEVGLILVGDENKSKRVLCCCLDGYNCDKYKFLKNDYLIVKVWDIIDKVYKEIGQPIDSISSLVNKCRKDNRVWDLFADGITTTINQADSDYDKQILTEYKPKNITELSAYVAAIRPGFASQLQDFIHRREYSTGVKELDDILEDSFHFLMYQENIMTYLIWLGMPEKDTYDIIKKISKKKFTEKELFELKERLQNGWINKIGTNEGFEKTWEIVELSAAYSFNASHSTSVAIDSLYGAYLKATYPLEYYAVTLQLYSDDVVRTSKMIDELNYFGIKLEPIKFRYSGSKYTYDKAKNTIHKNITSIKYFNESIGDTLYSMKDTTFNTFLDFLKVNPCDSRQTQALITLDFFSEFGKSAKLMKIYELYNNLYTKKVLNKNNLPIDEKLIAKYSRETKSQYRDIEMDKLFTELITTIEDKPLPLRQILDTQNEFLGTIEYINPKLDKFMYITNVDTTYSPKLTCYCLATGETKVCKISKTIFKENPIKKGDIIAAITERKNKSMKQDGKWVKVEDKFDDWITSYIIK